MFISLKNLLLLGALIGIASCSKQDSAATNAGTTKQSSLHWAAPQDQLTVEVNDSLDVSLSIDGMWGLHEYTLQLLDSENQEVYYEGDHSHQWTFELERKIALAPYGPGSYSLLFRATNHNNELLEKKCVVQVNP
ncbi:MAG: hypothetical protein EP332_08935 [Bacteroidetes bacterium]|nr:MAG: hypothetical protein EP332_08935 [Bacteroidota bacterium]